MSKHKKQHIIPKCYLKAWCDNNCPRNHTPYIWRFEKDSKIGKKKAPEKIFRETDMYTVRDENGNRDLKIEHGLSGLETDFSTIRIKKVKYGHALDETERLKLIVFIAAMHARTKSQLSHMANQWRSVLGKMDKLSEQIENASEEKKSKISRMITPSDNAKGGFSHEQVREMVNDPVKTMLVPMITAEFPLLAKLDLAILTTDVNPGFITSDSPCVWFDEKSHTRPPMHQAPALIYDTIEITLPISPNECLYLNRQGKTGYQYANENVLKELNRRTRFHAHEYYVVNQNYVDDIWFDPGTEPEDSWEKLQSKKGSEAEQ